MAPFTEEYGRLANLNVGPGFAIPPPVTAAQSRGLADDALSQFPDCIRPTSLNSSPRLSFAWRPIFGGSMVVPRRLGHLLQHLDLPGHRTAHGPAGSVFEKPERSQHAPAIR